MKRYFGEERRMIIIGRVAAVFSRACIIKGKAGVGVSTSVLWLLEAWREGPACGMAYIDCSSS